MKITLSGYTAKRIDQALHDLRPGTSRNLSSHEDDPTTFDIEWNDETTVAPTVQEITDRIEALDYRLNRVYPDKGDQLDSIYKSFKHLKSNGVDIGPDGDNYIALIDAAKAQAPKPS